MDNHLCKVEFRLPQQKFGRPLVPTALVGSKVGVFEPDFPGGAERARRAGAYGSVRWQSKQRTKELKKMAKEL